MAPPVPTTSASVPAGNVPNTLLSGRESKVLLLVLESVAVTTAATPLPMAVALVPDARQIKVPTPELQVSVFPALVSAAPAETLSEVTAVDE